MLKHNVFDTSILEVEWVHLLPHKPGLHWGRLCVLLQECEHPALSTHH